MIEYKELCLAPSASVADAAGTLERNTEKICLVIEGKRLLGTITDGDIRRGLLRGIPLTSAATEVMNTNPRTVPDNSDLVALKKMMTERKFRHMPVVSPDGNLIGLIALDELVADGASQQNTVVLMAGGLGERLRPLTDSTPKPLLRVGDKPLLQSILENFIEQKFENFYIAVNYHAQSIMDHFGDGSAWGVKIGYLEEKKRMGTAGALSLLPTPPEHPVIVMNADLVTRARFRDLLDFHAAHGADATMCVREYDFQVPFGVVGTDEHRIATIDEKPVHRFFVNAGIYVLNPAVIAGIRADARCDMTQVFETIIAEGRETAAFPIHEYWLDIGRIDDLERAKSDFIAEQNK